MQTAPNLSVVFVLVDVLASFLDGGSGEYDDDLPFSFVFIKVIR